MNEVLIKELVKYKLNAASIIINHLPPKMTKELSSLGRCILDSVIESLNETKDQSMKTSDKGGKIDNITIE